MANQDQNLNFGWHTQKLGNTAGQSGFSQPATAPAATSVSAAEQVSAGAPFPAPAGVTQVLTNPGYAVGNGTALGAVTAPAIPASTVSVQNPSGLAALVTFVGGTVTVISTAPNVGGAAGTFTQVGTTTPATVTVPPAGFIKMTYSVVPTSWSWVTIN